MAKPTKHQPCVEALAYESMCGKVCRLGHGLRSRSPGIRSKRICPQILEPLDEKSAFAMRPCFPLTSPTKHNVYTGKHAGQSTATTQSRFLRPPGCALSWKQCKRVERCTYHTQMARLPCYRSRVGWSFVPVTSSRKQDPHVYSRFNLESSTRSKRWRIRWSS